MCKITAMRKTIAQLFATSLHCEQALLFWQAKRAAIERASELAGKLVTPPNGMTGKIKRSENNEKKKKHLGDPILCCSFRQRQQLKE